MRECHALVSFAYGNKRDSYIIPTILIALIDSLLLRNTNEIYITPALQQRFIGPYSRAQLLTSSPREIHISEQRSESAPKPRVSRFDRERRGENTQPRAAFRDAARDETDCKTYIRTRTRSCSAGPSIPARGAQVYVVV